MDADAPRARRQRGRKMTSLIKIAAAGLFFRVRRAIRARSGADGHHTGLRWESNGCEGERGEPEAIYNMGLVVNLTERTVSGFERIVAQINKLDAAHISFAGTGNQLIPECRCRN